MPKVGHTNQEISLDFIGPSGVTKHLSDLEELLEDSLINMAKEESVHQIKVSDKSLAKFEIELEKQI